MSKIEWTGKTWNTIVGCTKASPGCANCYAMGDSPHRFPAAYDRDGVVVLRGSAKREGMTFVPRDPTTGKSLGKGAQWTGEVRLLPWALAVPLRRKVPTTYFVNSLGDTFHASIVDSEEGRRFIAAMFGVMAACPQHTFQVLTKRPEKAREWFAWVQRGTRHWGSLRDVIIDPLRGSDWGHEAASMFDGWEDRIHPVEPAWPLPNVWIGASVEDQARADERIHELLKVPAALRFLSCEPLLGPLDLMKWIEPGCEDYDRVTGSSTASAPRVDWVIAGGESGPKARACELEWIRDVVEQCAAAQVSAFVKQLGAKPTHKGVVYMFRDKKGGDMAEWIEDLRVREMPT